MSSLQDYLSSKYLSKKEQKRQKKLQKELASAKKLSPIPQELIDEDDIIETVQLDTTEENTEQREVPRVEKVSIEDDPMSIFVETSMVKNSNELKNQQYSVNRYKIKLGFKWDGIDRSNGFEQELLNKKLQSQHLLHTRDYYDDDIRDALSP